MHIRWLILVLMFVSGRTYAQPYAQPPGANSEQALSEFTSFGSQIDTDSIRRAATSQNGRIKPFSTLSRETMLFLTGSYRKWGLSAEQIYLSIAAMESSPLVPVIQIRNVGLRKRLGFSPERRHFSLADLESSPLANLAAPLLEREKEGGRLGEEDKAVTEAFAQMNVFRQIYDGQNFIMSLDFSWLESGQPDANSEVVRLSKSYLSALKANHRDEARSLASQLMTASRTQPAPDLMRHSLTKLDLEILFYDWRPFLWASALALFFGLLLTLDVSRKHFRDSMVFWSFAVTVLLVVLGLSLRVYITQFAPVTNMYGTMIWVAFGVSLFGALLFFLYRNKLMSGLMLIGTGLILLLTENFPLILSPDMDPIVAVLRSNFWLSTHVTTITISYAAFTIAMILGNVTLVRFIAGWLKPSDVNDFFKYAYRMVQLGCFLLTVGIILGGIWADYSWGRFWGWDPKETWALIADMGFLVILHARYVGWVNAFTFLALSPVAYLLVIMAWYGVNFILAAGLHSYGFSSGGALTVAVFVGLQMLLFSAALLKYRFAKKT